MEIKKITFDNFHSQKILNHMNPINLIETTRMFSQEDNTKPTHKKSYALLAGLSVIVVIVAVLLVPQGLAPQNSDSTSPIQLSLNYAVGQHMVYTTTTNVVTNQMGNTIGGITGDNNYNSTTSIDVLSFDGQTYRINETADIEGYTLSLPPFTINVSKTSYYNNFAPGAPPVFYNSSRNPTISAYLAQPSVNVGDVWTIPVSTGNSSLGLTGEMTLKFTGFREITVPAGTYKTFKIDVSSGNLTMHYDPAYAQSIHVALNGNYTLRLSGTTYLEQDTCRLIKSELTQYGTQQSFGSKRVTTITSTVNSEKTLIQDT
jgi:hypothetical protein